MNLRVDYWMLGLIEELIKEKKMENQKGEWQDHKDCDYNCKNRWCERFGQLNLILVEIHELRERVETEIKNPPQAVREE